MSGFTASASGGSERLDVEVLPSSMQLCTLYGIADLHTQKDQKYGDKNKCIFAFEFPQHFRTFYEDADPLPIAIFVTENMFMNKKANLRKKWVEPMSGITFKDDKEAENFDISSLVGKAFVATITHNVKGDKTYANISSITKLDDKTKLMFGLDSLDVAINNDTFIYHKTMGFEHPNFASLPKFIREQAKESIEGVEHAKNNGVFAEPAETSTNNGGGGNSIAGNAKNRKLVMLPDAPNTYEEFMACDWTDDELVQNNFAKWEEVKKALPPSAAMPAKAMPTKTMPNAVPATETNTVPAKAAPPVKEAPAASQEPVEGVDFFFKITNENKDLDSWTKNDWTKKDMIDAGHAKYVDADGNDYDSDVPF